MPGANVYTDTLLRAASNLGSSQALASRLGVTHEQLRKWMRGEEVPPTEIFLRAVDLIEKHYKPADSDSGGGEAP
jgi:DNA-binding transcriptional regulator YiaG